MEKTLINLLKIEFGEKFNQPIYNSLVRLKKFKTLIVQIDFGRDKETVNRVSTIPQLKTIVVNLKYNYLCSFAEYIITKNNNDRFQIIYIKK